LLKLPKKFAQGELKAVDLVKKSLAKIEETKDYNAIISTNLKSGLKTRRRN
jgi:Asp-tRNA(Asn)/Glu-tRNA(Gln) amidotransferase A subunit family amidase